MDNIAMLEEADDPELLADDSDEFETEPELGMWAIVRRDLGMDAGKLVEQAGHGFLRCSRSATPACMEEYMERSEAKITVRVKSEQGLLNAYELCVAAGLNVHLIKDRDLDTHTVACVGPCMREQLPIQVSKLPLLTEKTATP